MIFSTRFPDASLDAFIEQAVEQHDFTQPVPDDVNDRTDVIFEEMMDLIDSADERPEEIPNDNDDLFSALIQHAIERHNGNNTFRFVILPVGRVFMGFSVVTQNGDFFIVDHFTTFSGQLEANIFLNNSRLPGSGFTAVRDSITDPNGLDVIESFVNLHGLNVVRRHATPSRLTIEVAPRKPGALVRNFTDIAIVAANMFPNAPVTLKLR